MLWVLRLWKHFEPISIALTSHHLDGFLLKTVSLENPASLSEATFPDRVPLLPGASMLPRSISTFAAPSPCHSTPRPLLSYLTMQRLEVNLGILLRRT